MPCWEQPKKQALRSKELQKLEKTDQSDRANYFKLSEKGKIKIALADLKRRQRVGEIFGEGCFKTAADFRAAALIYQHGEIPDHFYQAFVWANRAVQLGDKNQKQMAALAIDRYLVSIGHKQLFSSQAKIIPNKNGCFCMQQSEKRVPGHFIKEYGALSVKERYALYKKSFNQDKNCTLKECSEELKPTPRGTIPGFW
ncbi:hypothetical protein TUM19329_22480 [Legionella antarctica]|uniref:Uncharacterized protein n=2 Tax=Legionella antarctica TaxID=2708020 RepID=A0A6F8T6V3_9GAMM|nr:hypothetical protein TUM19329_22480 [Legionella antarctica]